MADNITEKYYTPDISEFHIGFEYEEKREVWNPKHLSVEVLEEVWEDRVFDGNTHPKDQSLQRIRECLNPERKGVHYKFTQDGAYSNEIRVKHLDHEDIESLGWEKSELPWQYFLDGHILVILNNGENQFSITALRYDTPVYYGALLNKSELKRIMKMTNINQ